MKKFRINPGHMASQNMVKTSKKLQKSKKIGQLQLKQEALGLKVSAFEHQFFISILNRRFPAIMFLD